MAEKRMSKKELIKRILFSLALLRLPSARFNSEKDYFIENFSMLTSSGVGILNASVSLKEEMHSRRMKEVVQTMIEEIKGGSSVWRALEKAEFLPASVIALIRVGEESGRLSNNLKVVAIQRQKDQIFRSKIRSAMIYPSIVVSLTLIVGVGTAWFLLPKLALVFVGLKIQLPLITRILIAVGTFLAKYGFIVMPALIVLLMAMAYFLFVFSKTKFIGEAILLRLPGIKKLLEEIELARFGFVLGTLLEAGLPVVDALDSLERSTSLAHFKDLYGYLKMSVKDGNSFQKSFASYKGIENTVPFSVRQIIASAEESGRLPEALLSINQTFEERADVTTKNLMVILEPVLLVVIWLGVLFVALSVILPIYSLISQFR